MRAELIHVDHPQPGGGQRMRGGQQRQVREMLMVDRVVLPPLDQPEQVRELERHQARVLDQRAQSRGEAADIRHMSEDVIRGDQVSSPVLLPDPLAGLRPEELDFRPDAARPGSLGHVGGRLYPEHRDSAGRKVLQQVAIVASHLDDLAVSREAEPADHRLRVPPGMRYPGVGVRGEVGVVGKDVLARHVGR